MLVIEFIILFQAMARQLADDHFAEQWAYVAGEEPMLIPDPETAAAWANLGYTPSEAAWVMADGLTLDKARRIP